MIPVLLLLGFVAGLVPKGWIFVPVAAVAWPAVLVLAGIGSSAAFVLGSGALAAGNAGAGLALSAVARSVASGRPGQAL